MTPALLVGALLIGGLPLAVVPPFGAMLALSLAAALALVAALDPAEEPPPEEVTTAAIFALHGHV